MRATFNERELRRASDDHSSDKKEEEPRNRRENNDPAFRMEEKSSWTEGYSQVGAGADWLKSGGQVSPP